MGFTNRTIPNVAPQKWIFLHVEQGWVELVTTVDLSPKWPANPWRSGNSYPWIHMIITLAWGIVHKNHFCELPSSFLAPKHTHTHSIQGPDINILKEISLGDLCVVRIKDIKKISLSRSSSLQKQLINQVLLNWETTVSDSIKCPSSCAWLSQNSHTKI